MANVFEISEILNMQCLDLIKWYKMRNEWVLQGQDLKINAISLQSTMLCLIKYHVNDIGQY